MSVCCVRCKSVSKLPIFCNSCYQESFNSGERRGRIEELNLIKDYLEHPQGKPFFVMEFIKKRLLELEE